MKKIPSLFKRDYGEGQRLVYDEIVPGTEWVVAGEGVATRKFDGTCCMIKDGEIYRRYDLKKGRTRPEGFIPEPTRRRELHAGDEEFMEEVAVGTLGELEG